MTRALVTGGTGFIGSQVVHELQAAGWNVDLLVRRGGRPAPVLAAGGRVFECAGATSEVVDAVAESGADVVFHLATLFVGEHDASHVGDLIASNITFGTQVLEGIRAAGRGSFVCTGTRWQHYANADYSPLSLYAATKQAFESVAQYFAEVAEVHTIALHLTDCYGPGDPRRKLLSLLLEAARTGEPLKLSPGEQSIDLLHVSDAAAAFVIAGDRARARSDEPVLERFAVRTGRTLTLREFVELVEQVRGIRVPVEWGARPYRARETFGEWNWGATLPGWNPRVALEAGLRELD